MKPRPRVRKARATVLAWVRPALVASAAFAVVTGGALTAWSFVVPFITGHDYFRLRTVRVSSDETRVAPETLAEIAGLYEDASLWDVDPDAIRRTLGEASWVKQAGVTRHFPWQVSLSVSRRHAVAAAIAAGRAWLVDADGVLFREVEGGSVPDLPYLSGWELPPAQAERAARLRGLLSVLDAAFSRSIEVSELHMDEAGTVWLYAAGVKASVRLGSQENAATGLDRLGVALAELGPLADRARVIDTDYPGRIVIRGVDDKLPAMLYVQLEKTVAMREAAAASAAPASPASKPEARSDASVKAATNG